MNGQYLEFEKPIIELEKKIQEMKDIPLPENMEVSREIKFLEKKLEKVQKEIYSKLSRWQRVQLARHPLRPHTLDYIHLMLTDFIELHGDRLFADDKALVGGLGKLEGKKIMVIGQQKGRDTKQKLYRNFGMCHPEGYRKALRLMQMATKFKLPVVIFIDTPGAYPGIGAEERGQAEAIAKNIKEMSVLPVPIVIVIIGEGASGGALGIGVGDRIYMLENSWYSVISPEGCASILWRDASKASQAAEALRLTAPDLMEMKLIDKIIPEPVGGAHKNYAEQANLIKVEVFSALRELEQFQPDKLIENRIAKFRKMGIFFQINEWEET